MLDLLIIAFCLFLNAFFSAYEMAFVTISKEEVNDLDQKSLKKKILLLKKRPERTLSAIQIGITLVGAIAAAVGGTGAVDTLEPYLVNKFGLSRTLAEAIAVAAVIAPLTYASVVFGELVPKSFALKKPTKVVTFGTKYLVIFDYLLSPIVSVLEYSTNFLLRVLKLQQSEDEYPAEALSINHLTPYHQELVKNLVGIKKRAVKSIMRPLKDATILNFKDTEEEVCEKIYNVPYSRFPVVDEDVVVGMLLKKDLSAIRHEKNLPWQGILHPILTIKESNYLLEAFREMQKKRIPIAVVRDQNHQFTGIVTMEDILEEIVGDIDDRADYSMTSKILANREKIKFN